MDENDYHEISGLLKRRDSQREYLRHAMEQAFKYKEAAAVHAAEIQSLQQRLYKLGYEGL
jgi:hypothetical protein